MSATTPFRAQHCLLIVLIHQTLKTVNAEERAASAYSKPAPAVPVKRSVFPDYIVCLEVGRKFKLLRRHLEASYGLTPDQYRKRWGLPNDYPMVAPNYAKLRFLSAKKSSFGRKAGTAS